jgi:hypothetical protein
MSITVLTGVTTRKMIDEVKNKSKDINFDNNLIPDLVVENLDEIFKNN